jgi:transcriptional regulator with XRE-family HTH domain
MPTVTSDTEKTLAVAKRLRQLRGKRTQTAFGEVAGIPKQHVSRYESGRVLPSSLTLIHLAERMKLNLNWLLLGIGKVKRPK